MGIRTRVSLAALFGVTAVACGSSGSRMNDSSASSDGGGSSDAGPCGVRGSMRGKTFRTLSVGGATRTYIAYLPSSVTAGTPAPLVFVTHGALMNGADMFDVTEYTSIADSDGVAVAFLDGQGANSSTGATALDPWSVSDDGAAVCGAGDLANNSKAVDFAFLDAVKADLAQDQCLDASHVFATGFSMGGYFTHHVGCDRTDVRAIAPHSGGTIASLSSCATGHMPVIIFHGTSDDVIEDGCDIPSPQASPVRGFPATATLWAMKNGCDTTLPTAVATNGAGGGDGECYLYSGCPSDGQVELCTFTSMGHCWAGGDTAEGGAEYSCPTYASATQLEWSFFKKYAW
jgi:poly(3-hydroxybutyrate) depolymerase